MSNAMQSQDLTTTKSSPGKTRYWIAVVIVLLITSVTLAVLLKTSIDQHLILENRMTNDIAEVNAHLHEANELSQQRQEEIDLSKEQQETLRTELSASRTSNEELNKQFSESQAETTVQSERADAAEQQLKINADSSDMYRMLLYHTYSRLYREQKKDPQYPAIKVLDYTTSKVKSLARRKSPQAEASIRFRMGSLYSTLKNYEGSEQQAELAANSRKQLLGKAHPDTIKALVQLGYALHYQGKYVPAIDAYNQALSGARKQYGDDHAEVLLILEYLVSPLEGLKRFDDLVVATQEIYRIKQHKSSRRKDYLHYSMLHLGMALREAGRYEEAEAMFRKLLKSCLDIAGPDDKHTFEAKVCLAWTLRLQDKIEEADQLHDELTSLGNFMALIHKSLADESYGRYLCYLGKYKTAESYLLRNIKPKRGAIFTIERVELNPALNALIELYEAWGKPDEAEKMRKQLLVADLNAG